MFIIRRGRFALRSSVSAKPLAILEKDSHIGVISLLKAGLHRVCSCWSLSRGEFYVLSRESFLAVINDFPHMHEVIKEAALREVSVEMKGLDGPGGGGDGKGRERAASNGPVSTSGAPLVAMLGGRRQGGKRKFSKHRVHLRDYGGKSAVCRFRGGDSDSDEFDGEG